ncbi:MAG: 50S ribosomal protein L4 [Candidatus Marinimicrobia bacterium]|nr:50S ribosomal protein L4 [Candidatus Neomarinimicrobiota bacterium]
MELSIYSRNGAETGDEFSIEPALYEDIEINQHNIYLAVKSEMNNRRTGTHSTKTRAEKRGGGRKPWPQKGRGAARAGSIRSPLWVGGGVTFGPKPKEYKMKVNRKIKQSARKALLADKIRNEKLIVVEDFEFGEIKSRNVRELLKGIDKYGDKVLLAASEVTEDLYLSARNFEKLVISNVNNISSYEIINADVLVVDREGVNKIVEMLKE